MNFLCIFFSLLIVDVMQQSLAAAVSNPEHLKATRIDLSRPFQADEACVNNLKSFINDHANSGDHHFAYTYLIEPCIKECQLIMENNKMGAYSLVGLDDGSLAVISRKICRGEEHYALTIINPETGMNHVIPHTFTEQINTVTKLGEHIAVASDDGILRIVDSNTGKRLVRIKAHQSWICFDNHLKRRVLGIVISRLFDKNLEAEQWKT